MSTDPTSVAYADDEIVSIKEVTKLYEAVGWLVQAADPDALAKGVDRATYLVTARDEDGSLIGLARCLSDDVTVLLLQDVLVHPEHRRCGIGRHLVEACSARFAHVGNNVTLGDDDPDVRSFYESVGYTNLADRADSGIVSYIRPTSS